MHIHYLLNLDLVCFLWYNIGIWEIHMRAPKYVKLTKCLCTCCHHLPQEIKEGTYSQGIIYRDGVEIIINNETYHDIDLCYVVSYDLDFWEVDVLKI